MQINDYIFHNLKSYEKNKGLKNKFLKNKGLKKQVFKKQRSSF